MDDDDIVFDRHDPRERQWHRRMWRWARIHALWGKLVCTFAIATVAEASGLAQDPTFRWFYRVAVLTLFAFVLGPPLWSHWQDIRPRRSRHMEEP